MKQFLLLTVFYLFLSQFTGSSFPKLGGEVLLSTVFFTTLVVHRYFLSYPLGVLPPASQRQSDAATAFSVIVTLVALIWPYTVTFGAFLYNDYFRVEPRFAQLQMTRYGFYVVWASISFCLLGWQCLWALVRSREQQYDQWSQGQGQERETARAGRGTPPID